MSRTVHIQKALPPESGLAMPRHQVDEARIPLRKTQWFTIKGVGTLLARLCVFIITAALSYYGITEMYGIMENNGITYFQWLFLLIFSLNFSWVSYAFSQAFIGFMSSIMPFKVSHPEIEPDFKTAILMPVYNESPEQIRLAIETMRNDILKRAPNRFAFFILSDTNKVDNWVQEESEFMQIVTDAADCPVYYRRRHVNTERKAGNIADWVQRWGNRYQAMIVLDADSLMSAKCFTTLARRLAASPDVGLIQTLPTIIRGNTLYARLQQFANHCYGPIYARGLSAWHGMSSNFWGHNAIIRTRAFAQASGLPILPGKPPFGGHVLSHDFIEAALLRRAGWGVRFDTDLGDSFEEAPPSLTDVIIRDRRWCQGNFQHWRFMFAQGMTLPTRLHLFSGMMSYFSAVLWLCLIMVGLAIAIQAHYIRPEYFSNPSLFPTWPVFDSERAIGLFVISMVIVLAPKFFSWLVALFNWQRCRQFGGPLLLTLSVLTEVVLSALYAPILMVSQFGVVYSIFRGKDSGWTPQMRDDGALPWTTVIRTHLFHTLFGIVLAIIAYVLSEALFYWLLPITAGLLLSIPLSWISGGANRTRLLHWLRLLRSPEERYGQAEIVTQFNQKRPSNADNNRSALALLMENETLYNWHSAQLATSPRKAEFDADAVTGEWKMNHAKSYDNLCAMLTESELNTLLTKPENLIWLRARFAQH